MKSLYTDADWERLLVIPDKTDVPPEPYREPWRRDYSRILHSPVFRRLQGKTQLFPGDESDFFRNRLTHSLEVAQIAKSIAIRLNHVDPFLKDIGARIKYDVCESAGLAHDLGHPPFGHNGEQALDERMKDSGGFEGNAQTLRVLTKIEKRQKKTENETGFEAKKDMRAGLNLTYRTLASILKYDKEIPKVAAAPRSKPVKGYYSSERKIVDEIKAHVVGSNYRGNFRTFECGIMDIADDIAYSTYDLEDALKAGFASPLGVLSASDETIEQIQNNLSIDLTSQDVRDILYSVFGENLTQFGIPKNEIEFTSNIIDANQTPFEVLIH